MSDAVAAPTPRVKPTRTLGIDYGLARIGLAMSDERKIIALPLPTITAEKKIDWTITKVVQEIRQLEEKQKCSIDEIVIGLPLHMNGRMGVLADEVKQFVELIKKHFTFPIVTWDERLTTVQAERALRESSMTRKKRSQVVDSVTAVILLQSYLDHKVIRDARPL